MSGALKLSWPVRTRAELQLVDMSRSVIVEVTLTTGRTFRAELITPLMNYPKLR